MGQWNSKEPLQVGQKCIIQVDTVNSPTGWWIGEITGFENHDTWTTVDAVITGPLSRTKLEPYSEKGATTFTTPIHPSVNYHVYPYSDEWAQVVESFLAVQANFCERIKVLTIQRDELRLAVRKHDNDSHRASTKRQSSR